MNTNQPALILPNDEIKKKVIEITPECQRLLNSAMGSPQGIIVIGITAEGHFGMATNVNPEPLLQVLQKIIDDNSRGIIGVPPLKA